MTRPAPLLVVQPSDDYACRVRRHFADAVLLATPERAALLRGHPAVVAADLDDPESAFRALEDHAEQTGVRCGGIVCFVCEYLLLTAHLALRLGLPFHAPDTVRRTRRKDLSISAWQAAGAPAPPSACVRDLPDLLAFAESAPGPWILKPTDRTGSEWVLRVERREDLPEAHRRIRRGLAGERAGGDASAPAYLAQAFVTGREFSADLYVAEGGAQILRLTEKYLLAPKGLAGMVGAYYPAQADGAERARLQEAFERGAQALGIERGVAMVDAILSGDRAYLLEMALRPGGDCLPDLCLLSTGYDPIRTACRIALGESPRMPPFDNPAPVAALHLMASESGTIREIDFAPLKAHPAVVQVEPYREQGDAVRCWDGSYDDRILAACIVRYADPAELPALVESLPGLVQLQVEEEKVSALR